MMGKVGMKSQSVCADCWNICYFQSCLWEKSRWNKI